MSRRIILSWCISFASFLSVLGQSVIKESQKFYSNLLNKDVSYSIYLPDGYGLSERTYPVLYLLHGWTDDETSWIQMGDMQAITDRAIMQGLAAKMIVVMPNAWETWYVNSYDEKFPYEDMFFEELIPYIQRTYKARTEKQFRAIAGLSMGGYGAFLYTLHHPEYFTACAPLSAAIYTENQMKKALNTDRGKLFDKLYGKGNLTPYWYENSVLYLLERMEDGVSLNVLYYIDCGDDDTLLHGNNLAHELLREKNIAHEFRVRDGGHTWTYWRTALPSVLEFISKRFRRS
ncbi:alpha/beta hydrolase family protein [Phocaeicola plebeius]|uniref:alpha/beta hydrolase n=1 Tax=Phocaeicola plebeius TaxID=310297 RepID=UPI0029429C30|nr:alpha/beta hydrolase family protein [Phocaeicola plebeius]